MREMHLRLLVCPQTRKPLQLSDPTIDRQGIITAGTLVEPTSGNRYPIVRSIPRFVSSENYAASFGFQWCRHALTQQDSYAGHNVSRNRFFQETKWERDLAGSIILEAGCGAGRFTTHALSTGATVVSFDYSNAVEANYQVNGTDPKVLIVQADIYHMPFRQDFFDKVFCFGVLQHTPDPAAAFASLVAHLKPGGCVATDVYWKALRRFLFMKTWVRPWVKRMEPERLLQLTKVYVEMMWPFARLMRATKLSHKLASFLVPDRSNAMPGAEERQLKEWAVLDTFDWLAPEYDKPQTLETYREWHMQAELTHIEVHRGHNGLEGRAVKTPKLRKAGSVMPTERRQA